MKVMIHAHTTFSADGELHPQQLADLARSHGFGAVLVSDHFESLNPRAFEELVAACRAKVKAVSSEVSRAARDCS